MAETVASKNRRMRQDNLREALENGGHIQHVIDISEQLMKPKGLLESTDITRLKAAADIKLKIIDKYLPSLKVAEVIGNINHDHTHTHEGLQDADSRIADLLGQGTTTTNKASKPH